MEQIRVKNTEQEERIITHVAQAIDQYKNQCGIAFQLHTANEESRAHIINIGASVLRTKWNIGFPGGSFVQAVVNNNLMEAIGRADSINQDCLKFYTMLLYNTSYID